MMTASLADAAVNAFKRYRAVRIRVKLMGFLREKSPPDNSLEIAEAATIADVLRLLELPDNHVHIVTINGRLEGNREQRLAADDELLIFPPVGGGTGELGYASPSSCCRQRATCANASWGVSRVRSS
jgi:molybdopterin converting factor small subunit